MRMPTVPLTEIGRVGSRLSICERPAAAKMRAWIGAIAGSLIKVISAVGEEPIVISDLYKMNCLPAIPLEDGSYQWIVGSSFDEGEDDLAPREASDDFNREQARALVDYSEGDLRLLIKTGEFVGIRCVAGDRLPIIGALTQRPGIFLATALGSRGILWSALAAKLITAQLLQDDFALLARFGFAADLVAALAPARFFAGGSPSALGALASNSKPILPAESKAK